MMNKMNFAIIGLGFISDRHIEAIESIGGKILLTCDIEKPADYKDWQEMIKDTRWKEITHVSILTPSYLHYEMCKGMSDKIVLCEKPLCFSSKQTLTLSNNINTVLQLRHNPLVKKLKKRGCKNIELIIKAYREQAYWESWKGKPECSGGLLMNMGIHYIDLMMFLLGNPVKILSKNITLRKAEGEIQFRKGKGKFLIEFLDSPQDTIRKIIVDNENTDIEGATIPLSGSTKIINLHKKVYENLSKGVKPKEVSRLISLIEKLNE